MVGKIMKGIAGFYYVHVPGDGIYECRAKGIFRNRNEKPLVGDMVELGILDEDARQGNITAICDRKNAVFRPQVANVDQALVVFAAAEPAPNLHLLDYFLVRMETGDIPVIICFNKSDLADEFSLKRYRDIYSECGYEFLSVCAHTGEGLKQLMEKMNGKTTVLAGPSGVGKSSIMNLLHPEAQAETGVISRKLGRGKHTTRHSEIFCIDENSYLVDTPGFSSLRLPDMEEAELGLYFPEYAECGGMCRFQGCLHKDEPDCEVKKRVRAGELSAERYESYLLMLEEIRTQRKW
ncbi:MAG: ribosome small subunit-dependent GTPase A [Lachnospiraceae bacterium]|nr:ribosome small subunit-dependent GTPase A [Lachnospiraceae bacterium]